MNHTLHMTIAFKQLSAMVFEISRLKPLELQLRPAKILNRPMLEVFPKLKVEASQKVAD